LSSIENWDAITSLAPTNVETVSYEELQWKMTQSYGCLFRFYAIIKSY